MMQSIQGTREFVDRVFNRVRKFTRPRSTSRTRSNSKDAHLWANLPTYTAQQWKDSKSDADADSDLHVLRQAERLLKELKLDYNLTERVRVLERSCYGGFSDIYTGMMENRKVAVKVPRMNEVDHAKLIKKLMRELRVWFDLEHPNILPFRGFILGAPDSLCPLFVTDWMENGSIRDYCARRGHIDKFRMIEGITNGLNYLHNRKIVHGDIKAANVVISSGGAPMLMDFGISHFLISSSTRESAITGTISWLAPELFQLEDGSEKNEHTQESDIWALGMTYLEVLTGKVPYASLTKYQVLISVAQGCKPEEPKDIDKWDAVELHLYKLYYDQCCTNAPESRSKVADLVNRIAEIRREYGISSMTNEETTFKTSTAASLNQQLSSFWNLNPKLDLTGLLPQSLQFKTFGGCSDIWFGKLTDGMQVAIKRARVQNNKDDEEKFIKRLKRKLHVWFEMNHENILPLRGYARKPNNICPLLISEWMSNGSLTSLIRGGTYDKLAMMVGMTKGLDYLHSHGVVHGDLKSVNVVISPNHTPLLTDFGISQFLIDNATQDNPTSMSGTVRWMAPELVNASQVYEDREGKKKVDIWALGMVFLEILTKRLPYAHIYNDLGVVGELIHKREPAYPEDFSVWSARNKALWKVARSCWNFDPSERPTTGQLLDTLTRIQNDEMITEDSYAPRDDCLPGAERSLGNDSDHLTIATSILGIRSRSPCASHDSLSSISACISLDKTCNTDT